VHAYSFRDDNEGRGQNPDELEQRGSGNLKEKKGITRLPASSSEKVLGRRLGKTGDWKTPSGRGSPGAMESAPASNEPRDGKTTHERERLKKKT